MIVLTKHAREKFAILLAHGVRLSEALVIETVEIPDLIDHSRAPLKIAQKQIDDDHVLRVVYKYETQSFLRGRSRCSPLGDQ